MNVALLLKLWRKSPQGEQAVSGQLKQTEAEEVKLKAEIQQHEQARDRRLAALRKEREELAAELAAVEAQLAKLQTKQQELHFTVNLGHPGQEQAAHRECREACRPLREQLEEVSKLKAELATL